MMQCLGEQCIQAFNSIIDLPVALWVPKHLPYLVAFNSIIDLLVNGFKTSGRIDFFQFYNRSSKKINGKRLQRLLGIAFNSIIDLHLLILIIYILYIISFNSIIDLQNKIIYSPAKVIPFNSIIDLLKVYCRAVGGRYSGELSIL